MLLSRYPGLNVLIFMLTLGYRHGILVDVDNYTGFGGGSLITLGGPDKTKVFFEASSIKDFLEKHLQKIQTGYFPTYRGIIESYPSLNTSQQCGSITKSNGILIEVAAQYVHAFSLFSEKYFGSNTYYFFAMQVRIGRDQTYEGEHHKCVVVVRLQNIMYLQDQKWELEELDRAEEVSIEDILGFEAIITKNMTGFFTFENGIKVKQLGSKFNGWVELKYLEGTNALISFGVKLNEFTFDVEQGTQVIDNPIFRDEWMM